MEKDIRQLTAPQVKKGQNLFLKYRIKPELWKKYVSTVVAIVYIYFVPLYIMDINKMVLYIIKF